MTAEPRIVRVGDEFFDDLDASLAPERGPNGEPSTTDFLLIDLPPIAERFATRFEELPEIEPGNPHARFCVTTGRLVPRIAVYGFEAADGSIDLVGIELDLEW